MNEFIMPSNRINFWGVGIEYDIDFNLMKNLQGFQQGYDVVAAVIFIWLPTVFTNKHTTNF